MHSSNIHVHLTEKEVNVISQLFTVSSLREIAQTLHISYNGLETHLRNIRQKTDTHSRSEILVWALQNKHKNYGILYPG